MRYRHRLVSGFEQQRARLRTFAQNPSGPITEKTDTMQECRLRLARNDDDSVDRPRGWLAAVLDWINIDALRTHRASPTWHTNELITPATPRWVPADRSRRTDGIAPRAISMNTGHHRLADGSVIRVDYQLGRWVGTLYTPDMRVKTQIVGSQRDVHAWADHIAA